jgi:hypothetical protein
MIAAVGRERTPRGALERGHPVRQRAQPAQTLLEESLRAQFALALGARRCFINDKLIVYADDPFD